MEAYILTVDLQYLEGDILEGAVYLPEIKSKISPNGELSIYDSSEFSQVMNSSKAKKCTAPENTLEIILNALKETNKPFLCHE